MKSSIVNPPGDRWCERDRLDRRGVTVVGEVMAELARAVGGVGEHLDRCRLAGEQTGGGLGVADVAGGQLAGGDQPGVGFDPDVGFEPVAVVVVGLVDVA